MKNIKTILTWQKGILFLLLLFTAYLSYKWFNFNQKKNFEVCWKDNLWADAGGYYLYLPALFIYQFDYEALEDGVNHEIDEKGDILVIGGGGKVINEKIFTKYYVGVSIMQAPFFLIIRGVDALDGSLENGFTPLYSLVPLLSSAFYYLLSMLFLFLLLRKKVSAIFALIIILITYFSTNAICYFSAFPGFSHAYSFFLVSAFLYYSSKYSEERKKGQLYILAIIMTFILITRPINIIIVSVFFIDNRISDLWKSIKWKDIVIITAIGAIICLPQLLYYKYLTGSFFTYSYAEEGFTNWQAPFLKEFWFSHRSGLFLYNPIWFLFIFIAIFMTIKRQKIGYWALAIFAVFSYLLASWHIWSFGCGFGSRNFVELLPAFALLLAIFYQRYLHRRIILTGITAVFIAASTLYSFQLMRNFEKCYFGGDNWDYPYFKNEMLFKK